MARKFVNNVNTPYVVPRTYNDGVTYAEELQEQISTLNLINDQVQSSLASIPEVVADAIQAALDSQLDEKLSEVVLDTDSITRGVLDSLYG